MKKAALLVMLLALPQNVQAIAGPGLGIRGDVVSAAVVDEDGLLHLPMSFPVPLPNWQPNGFQRWLLSRSSGEVALLEPRLSWKCPKGHGRSAVQASLPTQVEDFRLELPDTPQTGISSGLNWREYVLPLPELRLKASGKQVLPWLDAHTPLTLKMILALPGPATAWTGCVPTLHARTSFEPR